MNIKIITDSTAYLTQEEINKYNIEVLPMSVTIDGIEIVEGISGNGDFDEFFEIFKSGEIFPTTSLVNLAKLEASFKKALADGYKGVIFLSIASTMSSQYNTATLIAKDVDEEKIRVVDSYLNMGKQGHMAMEAAEMSEAGASLDEIVEMLEKRRTTSTGMFCVADFDYLVKGGRLPKAAGQVGKLLALHPILQEPGDSNMRLYKTVRGMKQVYKEMEKFIGDDPIAINIHHVLSPKEAKEFEEYVRSKRPDALIIQREIGPVLSSHLGPNSVGMTVYK